MVRIPQENRFVCPSEIQEDDFEVAGERVGTFFVSIISYFRSLPRERVIRDMLITVHFVYFRFRSRS